MSGRGLPFELFLSLRYLRARGQRANLSLFVWIGVGGVFLGVSALIVVLAVMTGFQDGIKERIIAANPAQAEQYRGGKEGLLGFFVGQVMKATGGKADARVVNELVRVKLSS